MSELRNMSEADKKWFREQIRSVIRQEGMKPSTEKALRWLLERELNNAIVHFSELGREGRSALEHERKEVAVELLSEMMEEDGECEKPA